MMQDSANGIHGRVAVAIVAETHIIYNKENVISVYYMRKCHY
jgi:hypothetical protein